MCNPQTVTIKSPEAVLDLAIALGNFYMGEEYLAIKVLDSLYKLETVVGSVWSDDWPSMILGNAFMVLREELGYKWEGDKVFIYWTNHLAMQVKRDVFVAGIFDMDLDTVNFKDAEGFDKFVNALESLIAPERTPRRAKV